jgi:hypothetical protein
LGLAYDYADAVNFATTGGGPEFWLVSHGETEAVTSIDDGAERVVASSLADMVERMIPTISSAHWARSANGVWMSDPLTFSPSDRVLGFL